MTVLPPGVHPTDRRASPSDWSGPPQPAPSTYTGGREPFSVPNARAMGVWQRATRTWTPRAVRVGQTPVKLVGRKRGRLKVSLWVPKTVVVSGVVVTVTHGVLVAASAGEASQFAGAVLNVGDSLTVPSEASVYAIALPTQVVGFVQYADYFNPSASSPGS
jgi:hypothetical protein